MTSLSTQKRSFRAPSNIALIKYMGKTDSSLNLPENSSLSMTLESLCTWVELEERAGAGQMGWVPEAPSLAPAGIRVPSLSDNGKAKLLRHVERVRAATAEFLSPWGLRTRAD